MYNEPEGSSAHLLSNAFDWARLSRPSQPLTVGGNLSPKRPELDKVITENSDVISFHNYGTPENMTDAIKKLAQMGRPLICSEWMARQTGSTPENILPVLYRHHVGAIFWGLVNGKTQTNYHWGSKAGDPLPAVWQHDIFRTDLSPYDPNEIKLFHHYAELTLNPVPR
jgi:hypothetical protein